MKHTDSAKARLFTRILPDLAAAAPYFSLETVRGRMAETGITTANASLQTYMSEAMKKGSVHDAGRGWYSGIAASFVLDTRPIKTVISRITKKFPMLGFSCWSTEQLNPYMEHLLAKFVTFVYADRDLISTVFDELRGLRGYQVYLDPKGAEAKRFQVEEKTVVIRPEPVQAPEPDGHAAPIEKLLVDLAVELASLPIMSRGEFQAAARQAVAAGRISMGALLRYAERRYLKLEDLFGETDQAMSLTTG